MNANPVGTVLLQKYRIDRHTLEGRDVSLYDATDLPQARHVCIKVFRSSARFQHDVCGPRVVDVGASEGLPYVVVGDAACAMPRRSKPPPLPAGARSKSRRPPPLPPREPSVIVALAEDEPTVVEPSTLDEAVLEKLRAPSSSRMVWIAVVAAVLSALAGWWLRERLGRADVAPPHAPSVATWTAPRAAPPAVVTPPAEPADTTRAPAAPPSPPPPPPPEPGDPLTL